MFDLFFYALVTGTLQIYKLYKVSQKDRVMLFLLAAGTQYGHSILVLHYDNEAPMHHIQ